MHALFFVLREKITTSFGGLILASSHDINHSSFGGPFLRQSPICCQSLWEPTQNLSFWSASAYLCRGGGVCLRWPVTCREGAWQLLVDTCSGASTSHLSYHYLAYSFNEVIWKKMASSQMKSSTLHSISSFYTEPKNGVFSFLCWTSPLIRCTLACSFIYSL